jgi:hypothetical protein
MAEAKGKQQLAKMKFENDAQRRDYEKSVLANPMNVNGLPPFFPKTVIKSSFNAPTWNCETKGHRPSNTIEKFCTSCFVDLPQTEPQAQEV